MGKAMGERMNRRAFTPYSRDTKEFLVSGEPKQRRYRFELRPGTFAMIEPEIFDGEELLDVVGERKYRVEKGKFDA